MTKDLDDILEEVGQFGKYQMITYFIISLPMVFAIVSSHSFVFTSGDLTYRCRIPECEGNTSAPDFQPDWLSWAVPMEQRSGGLVPSQCYRYAPVANASDTCSNASFASNVTVRCDKDWLFKGEQSSIVKELDWDLTCDENKWKLTLSGTLIYSGALLSKPLTGYISDKWGRKIALLGGLMMTCFTGILRSLSYNYTMFQICNIAEGIVGGGIYTSAFVMGLEIMGPKKRVLGGSIMSIYNPIGELTMGFTSWYFQIWRHILRVIYIPALLFASYFWLLPESVRWLMAKGRMDEAQKIIEKAAKVNGVILTENYFKSLTSLHSANDISQKKPKKAVKDKRNSLVKIAQSRILLCRLLTCSFCWMSVAFVFAGMTLNSTSMAGNKYLNYILTGLIEMPSPLLTYYGMNRFGRKITLCSSLMASGICSLMFIAIPADLSWVRILLYLFGKFNITISFDVLYIFAVELFPTELRQTCLAACSVLGGMGQILAPQVPLLSRYMESLPLILFGSMSIASGILALLLPETHGTKLPDTVEDAENISLKKRHLKQDALAQTENEGLKNSTH